MTTETKTLPAHVAAQNVLSALRSFSQYAADEAKLWSNHGKTRIYFGKKFIEFFDDGSCDCGKNPYSVSAVVSNFCRVR